MAADDGGLSLRARYTAVGCVTLVAGVFSGGMIGVLVSKVVAAVTRAPSCPDLPSCDWYVFAGIGMLAGGLTLPLLAIWRLRQGATGDEPTDRG